MRLLREAEEELSGEFPPCSVKVSRLVGFLPLDGVKPGDRGIASSDVCRLRLLLALGLSPTGTGALDIAIGAPNGCATMSGASLDARSSNCVYTIFEMGDCKGLGISSGGCINSRFASVWVSCVW